MATFTWIDGNGSWTTAGDWSTDSVPKSSTADVFIIDGTSTVTLSTSVIVDSLQLASGNALDVSSGSALTAGSQIDNAGVIQIAAGPNNAALETNGPVSLTGGGTVTLSNSGASVPGALIAQSVGGSPLTNVNNTIEGFGQIGGTSGLALVNEGTVDANVLGQTLTLSGGAGTNLGLLEATGSGALSITTSVNNTGGDITADGATVAISNSAGITGGTLNTSGGGILEAVGGTEALNGVTISSGSTYTIGSGGVTQLEGTIDNAGTILIAAGTNNAGLDTDGPVSLAGGGTVILSNGTSGSQALIAQSVGGSPLTNVNNTIEGSGQIGGAGGLALVNEGTVDANVLGQTLTLSGGAGTNLGLLEATGSGALSITTSVNNTGGDITADGATVAISNSAGITGGTLNTSGGGILEAVGGTEALNGVTISSGSTYTIGSGGVTQLEGTIDNAGTILIAAGTNNAGLDTDGPVSLAGGGTVILSNGTSGSQALIAQSVGGSPLTNVNNTIEGSGQIGGAGGLALVNEGTVDANAPGQMLTLSGGGVTNSGLLEASNGGSLDVTTTLGGGGQLESGAGGEIELAGSTSQTEKFSGAVGAQLRLDAPASYTGTLVAFAPGETIDLVDIDATSAVISGTTLIVDINGGGTLAYAVSAPYAGDHLMVSGDNNGGTDIVAYGLALPGSHLPEPANLGNVHVGAVATQALSLANTAPANGYYETLDARIGDATAEVTATGSFSRLAAGATDGTDLVVGLNTSVDGNKSGTATIKLTSDGTGVDGLGTTAIGTQTVTVNGAVYNYATASAATPDPVNFGERHVGDALSQALSISNTGTTDGFTENLDASISSATGAANASGAFTGLAAGKTNSSSLMIGLSSAKDGAQSGTATIMLNSDGTGIDGLGISPLAAQTIVASATLYNLATASAVALNPVNFGIVHVGDAVSKALTISNQAAADGFSENLDGGIGVATGAITATGSFSGLAASATDATDLGVGVNTSAAGTISGTAAITLQSDGNSIDTLGTTVLAAQTVTVDATVNNYATAEIEKLSGGGTLAPDAVATAYTLDFGTIVQGTSVSPADLEVLNNVSGPSDLLSGSFTVSGSGAAFTNTLTAFAGIAAGAVAGGEEVSLSTSALGAFSESVTLLPSGSNASGFLKALPAEVVTVIGTVVAPVRTLVWTGTSDKNFANAANWNDTTNGLNPAASPPGAADTAEFGAGDGEITGTGTAATLLFNNNGDWQLTSAATVTVLTQLSIGSGSASSVSVTKGAELATKGKLSVGSGGTGILSVTLGGSVAAGAMDIAALAGGSGIVSAIGTGSSLSVTGQLTVGDSASAELSILNGATVSGNNADVGLNTAGTGNIDIEGTGSELSLSGNLNLGDAGTGVLTLGNNTSMHAAGNLNIGANGALNQFGGTVDPSVVNNTGRAGGKGSISASVSIANSGTLFAASGTETLSAPIITGTGVLEIDSKADLAVNVGSVVITQTVAFTDGTGVLTIGTLGGFSATIGNIIAGDSIVVQGTSIASLSFNASTHVLTLFDPSQAQAGVLQFGTLVTDQTLISVNGLTPCFVAGTRISTERGEVSVEDLQVGDRVQVVLGGHAEPVVWLGHRAVNCARHPEPLKVWPVCVAAHAFGPGRPSHDLWLSPDHAIYVGDVLIPVKYLINGSSIAQLPVDEVTYWHVELPQHSVLLAEGLPAESYLDTGDRSNFSNGGGAVALHPDFASREWEAKGCAPVVVTGPDLTAARRWIEATAGSTLRSTASDAA